MLWDVLPDKKAMISLKINSDSVLAPTVLSNAIAMEEENNEVRLARCKTRKRRRAELTQIKNLEGEITKMG